MGICTMGVATRGSTLTEELCLKLGFELDRGKRDFLITGPLASPASTWNTRGTRLTRLTRLTHTHTHAQIRAWTCRIYRNATKFIYIAKSLKVQHTHLSDTQHITMQGTDTNRLRFLLLLLYCSEKALLFLLFGWFWRTQIQCLGSRPDEKHTTRRRY